MLTDFERYGEWNPFILSANGTPNIGGRLTLTMTAAGKTFTVRPTVVEVAEGRVLRWLGRLGVRGLFDGGHSHTIEPTRPGRGTCSGSGSTGPLCPWSARP